MPVQASQSGVARRNPDHSSAMVALSAASDALATAKGLYGERRFQEAFESSRDAIRLVSSALMFRDGCICGTFGSSQAYLLERYPGMFPLEAWRRIEMFQDDYGSGPMAAISRILGKARTAGETEANEALRAATMFVDSARNELVL
ncbi:MAG: hypothetical protein AB1295_00775 [Candidatus Micrarchaeota archaeon]